MPILIIACTIILLLAGAIDGILEGWGFDGRIAFEKISKKVKAISYFGSKSWRLAYKNNDKTQGFKNLYTRLLGAFDFYHHADKLRKGTYLLSGSIFGAIGTINQFNWWQWILYFLIAFAVSGITKKYGMKWIRAKAKITEQ